MRLNRVLMYLALTLLVSVHSYANAATVNATMTASVNNIFADDPFGVSLGTQIIVNASYESDAVDLVPSLPNLGRYALNSLSFTVGGGTPFVLTNELELETLLNQPSNLPGVDEFDRIEFSSGNNNVGGLLNVRLVFARMVDNDSLLLSSILPPTSLPAGIDFESTQLRIVGAVPGTIGSGFEATIDSLDLSVVPVPAAIWLFGTALLGLAGFSRLKKPA